MESHISQIAKKKDYGFRQGGEPYKSNSQKKKTTGSVRVHIYISVTNQSNSDVNNPTSMGFWIHIL